MRNSPLPSISCGQPAARVILAAAWESQEGNTARRPDSGHSSITSRSSVGTPCSPPTASSDPAKLNSRQAHAAPLATRAKHRQHHQVELVTLRGECPTFDIINPEIAHGGRGTSRSVTCCYSTASQSVLDARLGREPRRRPVRVAFDARCSSRPASPEAGMRAMGRRGTLPL